MVKVRVFSVSGPSRAGAYFGFKVPGGPDYLELAIDFLSRSCPDFELEVCVAHAMEWGEWSPSTNLPNVKLCLHRPTLAEVVDSASLDHPSAQHGKLLDWLLIQHSRTEPILILDPDFYVLSSKALVASLEQLEMGYRTFGVTYPVSRSRGLYVDFPVVYFQVFAKTDELVFSPVTDQKALPGEKLASFARLLAGLSRLNRSLVSAIEGNGVTVTPARLVLAQLARLPLEISAGDPNEVRDTGFQNRALQSLRPSKVFDLVQKTSSGGLPVNKGLLLARNPELKAVPSGHLDWYAYRHATLENRDLRGQPFALRLLGSLRYKGKRRGEPLTTSALKDLNLTKQQKERVALFMKWGADFYAFENQLIGMHLGSAAKGRWRAKIGGTASLSRELSELVGE